MIYFIQDSLTYRIKIGFTGKDDVKARLAELQTGSSSLLYLLTWREGTKETEADLHGQFAALRTQGEWFHPGPELINYIIGCSAVIMARSAVGSAVEQLVRQSFPETKAELQRRHEQARENEILQVGEDMEDLEKRGVVFTLEPRYGRGVSFETPTIGPGSEGIQLRREAQEMIDYAGQEIQVILKRKKAVHFVQP